MNEPLKNNFYRQSVVIFIGLPLFIWAAETLPPRTLLKELLSVLTILAFSQMIGLFYMSRINGSAVKKTRYSQLIKWHKAIGYSAVIILLLHPFLLVVPRFFEAGIAPQEALVTILTTVTRQGVVLGLITWCLLLILGITAFVRKQLPISYRTWRVIHGILAMLLVVSAAWHAIDLGRHSSLAMSVSIALLAAGAVLLLLKNCLPAKQQTGEVHEN
jgi:predicted ferric reductase